MTNEELEKLGRRAVACKAWRWMPGMLARYTEPRESWHRCREGDGYGLTCRPPNPRLAYPDLSDPATEGCLRHLALGGQNNRDLVVRVTPGLRMEGVQVSWLVVDRLGHIISGAGGSFVCPHGEDAGKHALVAALETANKVMPRQGK